MANHIPFKQNPLQIIQIDGLTKKLTTGIVMMTGELEYNEPLSCCGGQASLLENGREWCNAANSTRQCQDHAGTHLEGLDCNDISAIGFCCHNNQSRETCTNLYLLNMMSLKRAKKDPLPSLDSDLLKFCCKPS